VIRALQKTICSGIPCGDCRDHGLLLGTDPNGFRVGALRVQPSMRTGQKPLPVTHYLAVPQTPNAGRMRRR
jgi:hypothetical protein